jgi:CheY-like chemotaxis protein
MVEDDPVFAELLRQYLEDGGYRVAHVSSSERVLEKVAELRPDAITLDIVMPGRDGLAALRELKADPRTAGIPVMVVSVIDERVRGLALGAFDWLVKPVQREALVATMQRALASATESYPLVLAIDDDPGALDVITAILEGAGIRVVSTTNPEQGLLLAQAQLPAAIVLDLMMPGMNGFEVISALRAIPKMRDVPIVIFSGHDLTAAERVQLGERVLSVLTKSHPAELVDELRRLGLPGRP